MRLGLGSHRRVGVRQTRLIGEGQSGSIKFEHNFYTHFVDCIYDKSTPLWSIVGERRAFFEETTGHFRSRSSASIF